MYRKRNEKGALLEKLGEVTILTITEAMLKEYNDEYGPFMGVFKVLNEYFPEVIKNDDYVIEEKRLRDIARDCLLNSSAAFSDPLYLNRVWFMAVETVLNKPNVYFKLRFPYIEGNET